jgi:hypothetical protein
LSVGLWYVSLLICCTVFRSKSFYFIFLSGEQCCGAASFFYYFRVRGQQFTYKEKQYYTVDRFFKSV